MTRILIIEDDLALREEIVDALTFEGFEVISAENGRVGVQMAQKYLPDLIISDITMPVLDGHGVLAEIRSHPTTAALPFIFLTAKTGRQDMRRGMEYGANDYLTKPFTNAELLNAVNIRLAAQTALAQRYEQKLENLRSTLIGTLPHELRTPLVSIMGFGELLMLEADTITPQQVYTMADAIVTGGKRLHRLIENYLLYAQIEITSANKEKLQAIREEQTEHPGEIIAGAAMRQAKQSAREKDLVLDMDNIPTRVSANNLEKITEELVDNAFKFSNIRTKVHVTGRATGNVFELCVADQGRGMQPEQIQEVGAHVQFDRAIYEQQGLGLGLIIVKRLAELHGGELMLESALEKGTKARVRLGIV